MHADHIDTHAGEAFGQPLGVLMRRRIGAGGDIKAEELRACPVLEHKMSVFYADKAVLSGRRVQQMRKIQNALIGFRHGDTNVLFHNCLLIM